MRVSFKLSDADREKWGGGEWVDFDINDLAALGYDRLAELERDIKLHDKTSITKILALEWPEATMLGIRAMAWLARQLSGLTEPAWPDFKPDIVGSTFRLVRAPQGGDADPPTGGSSEPPSAKAATVKTGRSKKG